MKALEVLQAWMNRLIPRIFPHRPANPQITVAGTHSEGLGHPVGGISYRHYADRAPLAFRAIMTLPQCGTFSAIL
jgi:hypothetical protein